MGAAALYAAQERLQGAAAEEAETVSNLRVQECCPLIACTCLVLSCRVWQ